MYGQFQNSIASAAKWLFFGFIIIIVMAVILGTNIKDATWLNPGIAKAEAKSIEVEVAHQQATYELQEQLAAAQTNAEIRKIELEQEQAELSAAAEQAYTQALNQEKLEAYENFMEAVVVLMKIIGISITALGGLRMLAKPIVDLRSARAKAKFSQPEHLQPSVSTKPIAMRHQADPDYEDLEEAIQSKRGELNEMMNHARLLCRVGQQSEPDYHRLREQIKAKQDEINELYRQAIMTTRNPASVSKKQRDRMPLAG